MRKGPFRYHQAARRVRRSLCQQRVLEIVSKSRPTALFVIAALLATLPPTKPIAADEQQVMGQLVKSRSEYTTAESWQQRGVQLRDQFLKGAGLRSLEDRKPPVAIVNSRREHDGYSVENVALETLPGFYCTGNLYRPLEQAQPGPAILCPHGHFRPLGRYRPNHQIRCAHFARMGATVFSYSMVGWQDSQQTTHDDPLVLALQTWNSLRIVDYLSQLAGVDSDRVGITGASGGGTQTFFLTLVDDRIKVSAPLVIVYPWSAPQGCLCEGGLPVMQAAETNAIELSAAIAPRPQLLISVGNDPTENFPQVGFPFIKHMYGVAGHPDHVDNVHFADEGHDFGPSKRQHVYRFFAKHLQLPDLPEDLDKIAIEAPAQMEVFNAERPLPQGAVQGAAAVARAFAAVHGDAEPAAKATALRADEGDLATYAFKPSDAADEALIFTPPGFDRVGVPARASGPEAGQLKIVIRDGSTGKPTFCRVNVVGPDGNYYEPAESPLKIHSLTGEWPNWPKAWGNRPTKAPIRYFGRFFYCPGEATVRVPSGTVRIEVWKGFEYRPASLTTQVVPGQEQQAELTLTHSVSLPALGYYSGDPHIHIPRANEADEAKILDLMQAEDIRYGTILAYNEPAGPYAGFMNKMDSPQFRGLGKRSVISRDGYHIVSGQEYRTGTYGHLNLFMLDHLVHSGEAFNADNWPLYGDVARRAGEIGGYSFYAHGGYAKAIYADAVQGHVDGVELLQFGVYRGIGLIDWYRLLNCGFRFPMVGACDYPACRKLGDCKTYVHHERAPDFGQWLQGAREGKSFVSTGPLLLLTVDRRRPGAVIQAGQAGPCTVTARVRVLSEVAPVTHVQLIVNGRVINEMKVPPQQGSGNWLEFKHDVELTESSWIAARAFSLSRLETPDAESHTNPVYVYLGGRAPYDQASLDVLVERIDGQIAAHKKRKFSEQARVIAYFERSRDILLKIREAGGAPAKGHPSEIALGDPVLPDPGARTHSDEELKAFLKPVPPKPIEEVLDSFETVDGMSMQLVAREPLVHDPIAAAFDESGNLYVCEMRDYPYKPSGKNTPIGSVRLLKDTDGDGRFDEGHVFADELLWAGGVAPWKGGVFVAAPPDIWYLKDTTGDNRADVRRKVFTGFGTGNQQAMLNNLLMGLDHKIYGATAGNGGTVRRAGEPDAAGVEVNGRDFRFDPVNERFETVTGTVQFGNTFDDWGNRFLCSESQPLLHAVLPQRYLARNPYLPVPRAIQNIAPGPVPSFRISPIERWRQVRSSRRIAHGNRSANSAGASHHVIDAAAGVTVYRGGAYPPQYYGNVFVGGAQTNLIHRRRLIPDGMTFRSERVDEKTEVVRSSDIWFRPVNFVNAPDGTMYVLDMSREVLETIHVPLDVTKFLDFRSGRDRGRIYRIAPPGFKYPGPPRLGQATTAELVAALESPHGWWRDTAHRLLYERQDHAAVAGLQRLLRSGSRPQSRLHALWSLQGLAALDDADLLLAIGDPVAPVRKHAVRLAESRLDRSPELLEAVLKLASDPDSHIRCQIAFSLGESSHPQAVSTLAEIAKTSASDNWIRLAILSSATGFADRLMIELLDDEVFRQSSSGRNMLVQLATVVGVKQQSTELQRVMAALAMSTSKSAGLRQQLVLAIGAGLKRVGLRLPQDLPDERAAGFVRNLARQSRRIAADPDAAAAQRNSAIQLLGCLPYSESGAALAPLLDPTQTESIQLAAVAALSEYAEADVGDLLLDGWRRYTPAVRKSVLDALLLRERRTLQYLQASLSGRASVAELEPARRSQLLQHRDAKVRLMAAELFGKTVARARDEVLRAYQPALTLVGDVTRGDQVFRRECSACHRLGKLGEAIGPDLASSPSRDPSAMLTHILDPNRYVLPNYLQYQAMDTDGRIFTGMIAAQTATSITLRREENKSTTILRTNIDELVSTGKSLMPEGVEQKVSQQQMADLLAFLQISRSAEPPVEPKLHIGTLPGLIEPKQ